VEEKRSNVVHAVQDLKSKLQWIPNWSRLPFIFGIAISSSALQIWRLTSQGVTDNSPLFSSALTSPQELMDCVIAAAHCGRVLRFYREEGWIMSGSGLSFNIWHKRDASKSVKFSGTSVHVKYTASAMAEKMVAFYNANADVNHLEHLVSFSSERHTLYLQPLGVNRLPGTAADLVDALRCVLVCLHGLHTKGYLHTDVRWSNVVWVRDHQWYVIDCTNFVRIDDTEEIRSSASTRCLSQYRINESPWSVKHELFQVGRLIEHVIEAHNLLDADFVAWKSNCLRGAYESADELLQAVSVRH